jgi:hypothetical protein
MYPRIRHFPVGVDGLAPALQIAERKPWELGLVLE